MILNAQHFVQPSERTYTATLAELGLHQMPASFTLVNCPSHGQHRTFMATARHGHFEEMDGPSKGRSWGYGHPPTAVKVVEVIIHD